MQIVQNRVAWLVSCKRVSVEVTLFPGELHWLLIDVRIKFNLVLVFKCLQKLAPKYHKMWLSWQPQIITFIHLLFKEALALEIQSVKLYTDERALFHFLAPQYGIICFCMIICQESLEEFKRSPKTHYCKQNFYLIYSIYMLFM